MGTVPIMAARSLRGLWVLNSVKLKAGMEEGGFGLKTSKSSGMSENSGG